MKRLERRYLPGPQFGSDSGQYITTPRHTDGDIVLEVASTTLRVLPVLSIMNWSGNPDAV